jgi:hypothetical protein
VSDISPSQANQRYIWLARKEEPEIMTMAEPPAREPAMVSRRAANRPKITHDAAVRPARRAGTSGLDGRERRGRLAGRQITGLRLLFQEEV